MEKVKVPAKKKDGSGDVSRPREKSTKKMKPKDKTAGESGTERDKKYVIPKVTGTSNEGRIEGGDARNANARGGRGSGRGACFICTVVGHFARECPKSNNSASSGYATARGRGRGRGRAALRVREKEL